MMLHQFSKSLLTMLACCGIASALTGCQTTVGGQTLPSAYYLRDDVQYFPAGPEFILTNTVQAIEQYKLDQQGFEGDFSGDGADAGFGGAGYDGP